VGILPPFLAVAWRGDPKPNDAARGQEAAGPAQLPQLSAWRVQELEKGLELPLLDGAVDLELTDPAALQIEPEGLQRGLDGADLRSGPDEAIGLHANGEGEPLQEEVLQRTMEAPHPGRGNLASNRVEAQRLPGRHQGVQEQSEDALTARIPGDGLDRVERATHGHGRFPAPDTSCVPALMATRPPGQATVMAGRSAASIGSADISSRDNQASRASRGRVASVSRTKTTASRSVKTRRQPPW